MKYGQHKRVNWNLLSRHMFTMRELAFSKFFQRKVWNKLLWWRKTNRYGLRQLRTFVLDENKLKLTSTSSKLQFVQNSPWNTIIVANVHMLQLSCLWRYQCVWHLPRWYQIITVKHKNRPTVWRYAFFSKMHVYSCTVAKLCSRLLVFYCSLFCHLICLLPFFTIFTDWQRFLKNKLIVFVLKHLLKLKWK